MGANGGFNGQNLEIGEGQTRGDVSGDTNRATMGRESFDAGALSIIQSSKLDDQVTGQMNLASADQLLAGFDNKDPFNQRAESRSLWETIKTFGMGPTLNDRVAEKVDCDWEKQDPKGFSEYERQKAQYEGRMLGTGPVPNRDDYPALAEHDKRVQELQKKIEIKVLQDMTPEQRKQMGQDMAQWEKAEEQRRKNFNPLAADISQGRPTPLPESFRQYQERVKQYTEYATI